MKNKGICLVGQSGGPTAVINASLLGLVQEAFKSNEYDGIFGAINGIEGILNENFLDFSLYKKEELELLKHTPSAALGSVRFKMPNDLNDQVYEKIKEIFIRHKVKSFFYIGGNDSMDTCNKLAKYFIKENFPCTVIGIPKTIDNDMVLIDHTPGFASAARFIATSLSEIYLDTSCYRVGRVTFVEIMGRDSGWLTASAALASHMGMGPDLIYVPEVPFNLDKFLKDVKNIYDQKKKVLVAVSEGIKDENGTYFLQKRLYNQNDDFGHLQLGGVGMVLAEIVNKELNLPVRSVELNILQRSAAHLLSKVDIEEAMKCGMEGIKMALQGKTGVMVCMERTSNNPYTIKYYHVNLNDVANYIKEVPLKYINEDHNYITKEYLDYLLPLIEGDVLMPMKHGLPVYFKIKQNKE